MNIVNVVERFFAISVILRDIRERTGRLSCQFIMRRARQCVSYVDIYTLHLTNASLMAEDKDEMEKIEEELSYEELAILRKVAMQRVRAQYTSLTHNNHDWFCCRLINN